MQQVLNPFTPIFGKVPACLAGRDELVREVGDALRSGGNDPALVSLFVGPRGSGKTALLSACADMAEGDGWVTARVTAAPDMLEEIILRVGRSASHLLDRDTGKRISGFGIAALGSVEWENSPSAALSWRTRMDDVLDQLAKTDTGLLVTVDEVDPAIQEVTTLVTAYQHFFDEGRKVALLMAGLPYGLSSLISGKTTSFLRRSVRHTLGLIADADVQDALVVTMGKGGKTFEGDALDAAVDAVGGFPYMLQLLGYRAWNASSGREQVSLADVQAAEAIARRELEERVYEATVFELTDADMAFLAAMLVDEGVVLQANLAERLGKKSGHVSKYKKRMLQQGIIQERARGRLEFCLPGFRDYLARQVQLIEL